MRLIRYELRTPNGYSYGFITATPFLEGSQFKENEAYKQMLKLIKPFQKDLVSPKLKPETKYEYRFFFTRRGNKFFKRAIRAIAKQAHKDGWTPVMCILDTTNEQIAYKDEKQVAIKIRNTDQITYTKERII